MAIKTDGSLWAWGNNGQGNLGQGNTTARSSPVQVGALMTWSSVSASIGPSGYSHTLAVNTDGELWAWGDNGFGQLGLGDTTFRSSPVQVGFTADWAEIAACHVFSLGIKTDGTLWGWGRGSSGQVGDGTTNTYSDPVQIGVATNWIHVAGGHHHSYALRN